MTSKTLVQFISTMQLFSQRSEKMQRSTSWWQTSEAENRPFPPPFRHNYFTTLAKMCFTSTGTSTSSVRVPEPSILHSHFPSMSFSIQRWKMQQPAWCGASLSLRSTSTSCISSLVANDRILQCERNNEASLKRALNTATWFLFPGRKLPFTNAAKRCQSLPASPGPSTAWDYNVGTIGSRRPPSDVGHQAAPSTSLHSVPWCSLGSLAAAIKSMPALTHVQRVQGTEQQSHLNDEVPDGFPAHFVSRSGRTPEKTPTIELTRTYFSPLCTTMASTPTNTITSHFCY